MYFFPYSRSSFDVNPLGVGVDFGVSNDHLPVGTIPIFATSSPDYTHAVIKFITEANRVYHDFLDSDDGRGFCGQVCLVGDSVGAILAYDALTVANVKRASSDGSINEDHRMEAADGE